MNPRPRFAVGGLEGPYFVVPLQRHHDFIEPLQQALAPPRIDLETMSLACRRSDRLSLQIDADASRALGNLDLRGDAIGDLLVDNDRQNSVLETIRKKD